MLSSIIIEDEENSREMLVALIAQNCPDLELAGSASTVKEGIALIKKEDPDVVFLDITMPDGSGFEVLENVPDINFEVIFTTATDKHAVKAIKYSALDYLLKPIDPQELKAAVQKAVERKGSVKNNDNLKFFLENIRKKDEGYTKITLPTGNAFEIVNIKEIIRCEAEGSYTKFILTDKRNLLVSSGLKHYEDLLPPEHFIRIHHHHLINMNHVVRYLKADGGYAVMSDGSQIEISRRKKDAFLERLSKL